ncbi:MAG: hypothetical protein Q4Q00_03800 [Turicibacter sp.]|nr:hypothetical protein [Turicibacter sp.]
MRKIWIVLSIVLVLIVGVTVSIYSVELTSDNIGTVEVGQGGQSLLMGLDETKENDLINELGQLTFQLSKITAKESETPKFDILVRDKSGKGIGVVKVYDETSISYKTSVLGFFSLEYQAKDGSLDLEKLSLLSQ